MYKQKRGAIALIGLVAMLVVVVAGSLFLASKDDNAITGALIGVQVKTGACNVSIRENIDNLGHDYICDNTTGFIIDTNIDYFDCQGHTITCNGVCDAGILLSGRDGVEIRNCYIYNFTNGIKLDQGTNNSYLHENYLINNGDGIEINNALNNNFTLNVIANNSVCGINATNAFTDSANGVNYNTIWNNKFYNTSGNGTLACSNASFHNFWYQNKTCSSTQYNSTHTYGQANQSTINIIGGPCLGGNYWETYIGEGGRDETGDGLGDNLVPYPQTGINNLQGDYYPLVDPNGTCPLQWSVTVDLNENFTSSTGECFALTKDNITLDCHGYTLTGAGGSPTPGMDDRRGIEIVGVDGVTVQNCIVKNFTYGIYVQNADNIRLINVTVYDNNNTGIYLGEFSDNVSVINSTIGNNLTILTDYGIRVVTSDSHTIENNIIRNSSTYGVLIESSSDDIKLYNNEIYGNAQEGVLVNNSLRTTIGTDDSGGNTIYNNSGNGIYLINSNGEPTTIYYNTIYNNSKNGILLENSENYQIWFNNVSENMLHGINVYSSDNQVIKNNRLFKNNFGLLLNASNNVTIDTANYFYNNSVGAYLVNVNDSEIQSVNEFYNNSGCGLRLEDSWFNSLGSSANQSVNLALAKVYNNTQGICLFSNSNNNTLRNFYVYNNTVGINVTSSNNLIYNNKFENNTNHSYSNSTNFWNTSLVLLSAGQNILGGTYLGGNYWGDYNGSDTNNDGIGDNANYSISGGSGIDYLPLTTNLAGCGNITQDATIVANITRNGTCFNIGAANITLNFAGYTLTGNGSGCGVNISNKDGVTIINANIQNFSTAICVDPAVNINISNNNLTQNTNGITFEQINNSFIHDNKIFNNTNYGIQLNDSHNNTIYTNNITMNNNTGLYVTSSENNSIYNNYFNNTVDAYDNGTNKYNTTYANVFSIINGTGFGGNFWSTYLGKDSGNGAYPYNTSIDGVGDTNIPFTLGNIRDYLPLTSNNGTTSEDTCLTIGTSTKLGSDVNCTTGDGITITANNVVLDCNGLLINGGGIASGILINNYNNTVIKNCNITNFYYGIKILNADGTQIIEGNDLQQNDFYGIYLYQTTSTLIDSNSLINDNNGVYMISSTNTNITNNTINLQKKFYGIYGYESTNNIINNNTLLDNYHGIYLVDSSYTNASNNNITASDVYSLFVHKGTTHSYFTNNNLSMGLEAIRIKSSSNNNSFTRNIISNHTNYGIYSTDSDSNVFTNNNIQNNSANVYLSNSSSYNFVNNNITLGTSGIQAISSSDGLILTNNTINSTTNTTPCLEINDSSNANISGNRFYNDVHLNNATGATIDLNNSVVTYLNINESDSVTLSGNTLNYVDIEPTSGTNITGNTIVQLDALQFNGGEISSNTIANNNLTAFNLRTIIDSYIFNNNIQNTTLAILISAESTGNNIYDSWLKDNSFGLNITNSTSNTIYNNYLSNGISKNVYDDSGNIWYSDSVCGIPNIVGGPCKGGNFYSDYYGLDNGANGNEQGDGIGDQPAYYTIAVGNTDDYPLVLYVARQYFDQNSPYNTTYNAYGTISGLLSDEEAVPNEVQIINYTNTSGTPYAQITGLFNQSDVHAETLKINHTENKTAVNRTGVTGEASTFSVYLHHNYEFDTGVYVCENTYNLSLDENCASGVNLTSIATAGAYTLSHNNGYYKIAGITNESITAGINKNGYCGVNILHDVTLTENVNCNGSAFIVSANDVTIDFAGYTLTGNSSGIGVNSSNYNNTIIQNANLVNFSTAIYADPATGINITNNNISYSGTGIYFSEINNSFIVYNMLWNNTVVGMNLSQSYNNTIYNNYFSNTNNTLDTGNNTYYVENTTGTSILSLANSAFSLGLTVNTTNLGGNYWSDYSGWDTSPDGFGDTLLPYNNSGQINNTGDMSPLTGIGEISCGGTTQYVTTNITLVSDLTTTGTCFTVTGNNLNLDCGGYSLTGDSGSTDYGFDMSTINGINITNCVVNNFGVGVEIIRGFNHSITSCTFENNTNAGISITHALSSNISILDATIYGDSVGGIKLENSSFIDVLNNTIYNVSTGIILVTSPNNTLTGNTISNNSVGINLTSSSDNNIYNNYFNSTLNAQDNGTNYWNTTFDCSVSGQNILEEDCLGGNFWNDYNGSDDGSGSVPYYNTSADGIGDTEYYNITNSSSDNVGFDYLPLMVATVCGDGLVEGSEQCEYNVVGSSFASSVNSSCLAYNWNVSGTIGCEASTCTIITNTSYCTNTTIVATPTVTDTGSGSGGGSGGGSVTVTATGNCTENWVCGTWSECIGSKQTRNCNDINLCESLKKAGTISNIIDTAKPKESRSCTLELVPSVPLPPQTPQKTPGVIQAMLPDSPIARTATLASLAAVLIFGGVYASWYLTSSRNKLKRKLRKITPLLGEESHDVLKAGYLDIYHLYLKLSEGHKQNYYSKVTKLREKLEDQLKAEKRIQELLDDRTGDIKEQKETYLLAYKQYQKLPEKVKKTYYPDLVHFRDQLERGKSS